MIMLSVDYGDRRTGIACCDNKGLICYPVTVINDGYEKRVIEKVSEIAKEKGAERIVVGLPKNMDGSEGFRAKACEEFALKLKEVSGIETVLYDERLTTVYAHKALNFTDTRGKKRKEVVDALSAVVILEDYLKSLKN
ncbi:MAG: Holliday junction resolvase RuvX [Ruminococcaceae bacterium]|nr:Holliday junction resolvase RuvX [Oscillospiraceae bacterium]